MGAPPYPLHVPSMSPRLAVATAKNAGRFFVGLWSKLARIQGGRGWVPAAMKNSAQTDPAPGCLADHNAIELFGSRHGVGDRRGDTIGRPGSGDFGRLQQCAIWPGENQFTVEHLEIERHR